LWAATAQPLKLFGPMLGENYTGNRNFIVHAFEGAFLRIDTGDPVCLNVRAEATTAAASLGCYANGVLLRVRDVEAAAGWVAVSTTTGEPGFVAEAFVER
jgi:hypothetical protein